TSVSASRVGGILVTGAIDSSGGSAKNQGLGGGAAGTVTLASGTIRIAGTVKGAVAASVNASGGTAGPGGSSGNSAAIDVHTFGTQPLPLNFDLASTVAAEPALPGGLLEIGNPAVNGTKGALLSGQDRILPSQRIISSSITQGIVTASADIDQRTINQ